MVIIGKRDSIPLEEAQIQDMKELQQEVRTLQKEVKKLQLKKQTLELEEKGRKNISKKQTAVAALFRAASDPKSRAVMTKVWNRRRKRAQHASAALRLAIRYLNARDRTTIFRNK